MKNRYLKILSFLSFLLLFSTFIFVYLSVELWDYDFWWHISTGRYIVENGHLPVKDPFSYTSELSENNNLFPSYESLILKNYWLSQIIFYFIYKTFGNVGVIFLRSSILLLIISLVFLKLNKDNVKPYIIFPFIFLTFITTNAFTGERPVLFTLLFSVIAFLLLDSFKKNRTKKIFFLIPLMIVWTNMHAGVMMGNIIIAAFIVGEMLDKLFKRAEYSRQDLIIFYSVTITSIMASALNPNGLNTLLIPLSPEFRMFTSESQEYQSVFKYYWHKIRPIDIDYISMLIIFPVVFILRAKKIGLSYIILLSGLLIMSATSLRFVIFFVIIGTIVMGQEVNHLIEKLFDKMNKRTQEVIPIIFTGVIFISSLVYFIGVVNLDRLKFEEATRFSTPKGAVDFIENNKLEGNMFNDFGFGGYIAWRLYPWKKSFIDTRSLNYTVMTEYDWILNTVESVKNEKLPEGKMPLWKRLLDHYKVNFILLDTLGILGNMPPLLSSLLEGDDKWVPVYVDLISVVFVRNIPENREIIKEFLITKETIYNAVVVRAAQWAMMTKNPGYLVAIGDTFAKRGMAKEAVTAYEYAIQRLPSFHPLRRKIEQIKEEIESKNNDSSSF